ncbi:MAG: hypothetical protein AAFT19_08980 [Pseudomonadota bacterium]
MTRLTDDLYARPTMTPTPEEVERLIARAHALRGEAMATLFRDIRRTLAEAVQLTGKRRSA